MFFCVLVFFFFFQAEDGIRDWSVTGVQTCALPISERSSPEIPRLTTPSSRTSKAQDRPRPPLPLGRGSVAKSPLADGRGSNKQYRTCPVPLGLLQPLVHMLADENIFVGVGVAGGDAVDFFHLTG